MDTAGLKAHRCTIDEVCDLSKTLTINAKRILGKGPSYIPLDNKDAERQLDENHSRWCPNKDSCSCTIQFTKYQGDQLWALEALKELGETELIVKKADKGNCFVTMTLEQYKAIANMQLKKKAYKEVNWKEHEVAMNDLEEMTYILHTKFSSDTASFRLVDKPLRRKQIYFLPKIHKKYVDTPIGPLPPGRPITDAKFTQGSALDGFFCSMLKPLRAKIETTVLGSLEAVIRVEGLQRKMAKEQLKEITFLTFDIVDLYTSIPVKEAMEDIQEQLKETSSRGLAKLVTNAMLLLLTNNLAYFGDDPIIQVDGLGMGWKCAPSIADIFVYRKIERKVLPKHNPLLYGRLLDDGLVIFRKEEEARLFMQDINNSHPSLDFTYDISKIGCDFLDLHLKWNGNYIERSIHVKPTSNLTVVHSKSDHTRSTKESVLFSRFLWFIRACDTRADLTSIVTSFWRACKKQGYSGITLSQMYQKALCYCEDRVWPYSRNPSQRIRDSLVEHLELTNIDQILNHNPKPEPATNKPKMKYLRCNYSQNINGITKEMVRQHTTNKPAWTYGRSLRQRLMKSNHVKKMPTKTNNISVHQPLLEGQQTDDVTRYSPSTLCRLENR